MRRRELDPRERQVPPREVTAPSRAGSVRVGPGGLPELLQTRIAAAPGLRSVSARKFAVGPYRESETTGTAGWQQIPLRIGDRDVEARVHYPASVVVDQFGRVVRGEGENAQPDRTFGGWPFLVLMHGYTPEEMSDSPEAIGPRHTSEETLCGGVLGQDGLELYKRWHSTQRFLASAGYVSVAPNLSPERTSAGGVTEAFLTQSGLATLVNLDEVGLVGHSVGASSVHLYPGDSDVPPSGAVAVLGPAGVSGLRSPSLTITAPYDINDQGGLLAVYREAAEPKHLVYFTYDFVGGYSHYSFFDGLCYDGSYGTADAAPRQRLVTRTALLAFFDHYLRGRPLPTDLGIDEPGVTIESSPARG